MQIFNSALSAEFELFDADIGAKIVNCCSLIKSEEHTCSFQEFSNDEQAKAVYEFLSTIGVETKMVLHGKIIIQTNSEEEIELLGYDFK